MTELPSRVSGGSGGIGVPGVRVDESAVADLAKIT
jgi:hypothetical protein